MRLIDADALIAKVIKVTNDVIAVHDAFRNAPTIEAEPVRHGRWVMTLYATTSKRGRVISNQKFACSECGYGNGRKQNNYCANCGAKMDGGGDE